MYRSKLATIGVQTEDSYGTEKAVTASELFLARDIVVAPEGDKIDRNLQRSFLGTMPHIITRERVHMTFTTEIRGDGSKLKALFLACGMEETGDVYTPVSGSFSSATLYAYFGGKLYKSLGVVGTFEVVLEAGEPGLINWDLYGLYSIPTDTEIVAGDDYESLVPPTVESSKFTIGSYAGIVQAINVAMNNEVVQRLNVNASWGIEGYIVADRAVAGSLNPEEVTEATNSFWTDWQDGNSKALSVTVGRTSGNKYSIACPVAMYDSIGAADREGIRVYEMPVSFHISSGNDEITISFI